MPFDRPTPTELLARIQAEFDSIIPASDARLRQSVEGVMARVLTMTSHELLSYLNWVSAQILPDTAESEFLDRHGSLWGIPRKAATAASGIIQLTGTIGVVVPSGTILRRSDEVDYKTTTEIVFSGATALVNVLADKTGANGNAASLTKINLGSPIAGVQTAGVVQSGGLSGGTDVETDAAYRGRIIERIRQPPQGGADFDYIRWAKEVAGVTRAWCYPNQLGIGTVVLMFVMDDKVGSIIPSGGEVTSVQSHVDQMRPVTAEVTVGAPTPVALNFEIHITPSTAAIKTAIDAELKDLIRRESIPGGTLYLSRIREAISVAEGEFDHVLVTPTTNVVRSFGEITVLGTITWGIL